MKILNKLKTATRVLREKGPAGIQRKLTALRRMRREEEAYQNWLKANAMTDVRRAEIRRSITDFGRQPLISIVLPVYNVDEKWLRRCLDTVLFQLYEKWELCIADDKSPAPHIAAVLREYGEKDKRIKVVFRGRNGHISAASNSALELATGEFCVLLDHDDELSEDALFWVANELNEFPETAFIYSDEDMIDVAGRHFAPKFKPDFSRDLFYSLNLITHLSAYRTSILREIGGFRTGLEGSQDYDLALRFIEKIDESQIRHIPRILYHWRAISGSVALSSDEKPYAHERARQALREHFERIGTKASVERGAYQFHRVRYELPSPLPKVSLILSGNADASQSLAATTVYENLEVIEAGVNAAALNRAVDAAEGEILCFAHAALKAEANEWLADLTSFAIQPEIGAVGAMIIESGGAVSEAGIVAGFHGLVARAHRGFASDDDGYYYRLRVVSNFAAISATCLVVRRELFGKFGGFDADNLPEALFDIDFCLRLGEANKRIVFVPQRLSKIGAAVLELNPSVAESAFFTAKWREKIPRDPFYNPNLSLTLEPFAIGI